jgi:hypothetical protein
LQTPLSLWNTLKTRRIKVLFLGAAGHKIRQPHCPNRPSQNEYRNPPSSRKAGLRRDKLIMRNAPVFAPVFTALRRGELLRRGKGCGERPNLISVIAQPRAPSHAPRCTGGMRNAHAVRVFSAPVQSNWVRQQNFLPAVHQALPD